MSDTSWEKRWFVDFGKSNDVWFSLSNDRGVINEKPVLGIRTYKIQKGEGISKCQMKPNMISIDKSQIVWKVRGLITCSLKWKAKIV